MNKKYVDLALVFVGLIGMLLIAGISIVDSEATDIISAVPVQLLFVGLFIAGYISYRKVD